MSEFISKDHKLKQPRIEEEPIGDDPTTPDFAHPKCVELSKLLKQHGRSLASAPIAYVSGLHVVVQLNVPFVLFIRHVINGSPLLKPPYWAESRILSNSDSKLLARVRGTAGGGFGYYLAEVDLPDSYAIQSESPSKDVEVCILFNHSPTQIEALLAAEHKEFWGMMSVAFTATSSISTTRFELREGVSASAPQQQQSAISFPSLALLAPKSAAKAILSQSSKKKSKRGGSSKKPLFRPTAASKRGSAKKLKQKKQKKSSAKPLRSLHL